MENNGKCIASVSWGKDSTAMLLYLINNNYQLDEVVFFNTGMEFDEVYQVRDDFMPILKERNILYTELKLDNDFLFYMFEKEVHCKDGTVKHGYGWCGGPCRWCTSKKLNALDKYTRPYKSVYVGITKEEEFRVSRFNCANKIAPLVAAGFMEIDALQLCYDNNIRFGGLYEHLDRVSCWCCRNKNLKELSAIKKYYPVYFNMLVMLELRLNEPMKKPIFLSDRKLDKDCHRQLKML